MNAADVVAIAHDGELVCEGCLCTHAERAVFYDWPDAQKLADQDGYLSPAFADQIEPDDICGRCLEPLL
jgi:hypothetical protein